jgi:hypothetical protein
LTLELEISLWASAVLEVQGSIKHVSVSDMVSNTILGQFWSIGDSLTISFSFTICIVCCMWARLLSKFEPQWICKKPQLSFCWSNSGIWFDMRKAGPLDPYEVFSFMDHLVRLNCNSPWVESILSTTQHFPRRLIIRKLLEETNRLCHCIYSLIGWFFCY